MKTYSIGRDLNCDIVINDSTDVISRRHALLNVTPSGKMTIIDQSSNGTYVNGIRITQNVPVPVTKKDIVSLAHVAKLDWNQIPKSNQWIKYLIWTGAAIIVILAAIFGIKAFKSELGGENTDSVPTELNDSTLIKQREAARLDSIKNVERQDSIKNAVEKARQDSIKATKKEEPRKKKESSTKQKNEDKSKSKDKKDKDKSSQNKKRAIG